MNSVWRIVDANFNRSREGLRVLEDISRFIMNDSAITKSLKSSRHELSQIYLSLPIKSSALLSTRESGRDVGKKSLIRDERKVLWQSLVSANLKRVQESLRVLEEC